MRSMSILAFILFATIVSIVPLRAQEPRMAPLPTPIEVTKHLNDMPWIINKITTSEDGISFEELWEIARQNNPSLRQKGNKISVAQGKRVQAGLYPNPTLGYGGDNLGVDSGAGKHGLSLSQEWVMANKKKIDRHVASFDVDLAKRDYAMECLRLQNDLRIAQYELLHARLTIDLETYFVQISKDLLDIATSLEKPGKKRSVDILQFRTSLNESSLTLRHAENNRQAAWQRMTSILGTPDLHYQPVRGTLHEHMEQRDWNATWYRFQQISPQLAVARVKVQQARAVLARQEAERVANVSSTLLVSQDIPAKNTVPFVGLSVPLKIHDRNQGNIRAAQADIAAAGREVDRVLLGLHKQLSDVFRDYDNAREVVVMYEKTILPDMIEAFRQIRATYEKGELTYLELYNQRSIVLAALLRYIDALKNQAVASTLIDGLLLQGTLD